MARVGYARVSSTGQSLELQLDKLKGAGCDKVFHEKPSGSTAQRPQYKACMEYLREGIAWSLLGSTDLPGRCLN